MAGAAQRNWAAASASDRIRYVVFLVAVLMILGGAILANRTLRALMDTGGARDHAQATINVANRLAIDLRRAELAARNYARSGEPGNRDAYRGAAKSAVDDLASLSGLVAEQPEQRQRLEEIAPLMTETLAIVAVLTLPSAAEPLKPERLNAQIQRSDALAEALGIKLDELIAAEDQTYRAKQQAAVSKATLTQVALLGTTGFSALAICWILYRMTLEIRRRRAAEAGLSELNSQLANQVEAQTADLSKTLETLRRETAVRRAAERRLRELQLELVRASRLTAIGQVGAMLAHEINQPLTATLNYLHGAAGILKTEQPGMAARLPDLLERAEQQTIRAAAVVQRLREYVGRRETHQAAEALPDMIEDARALALAANGTDVSVRINLDPAARVVVVDRAQIVEVLVNLMRNALEAMADSERRELVISTALRAEGIVEVAVADSGSGLPEQIRRQLFAPFISTKPDGLGIGLSSCQAIVEAHGGNISAERRAEGGTVFRFTLHGQSPRTPLSGPIDASGAQSRSI